MNDLFTTRTINDAAAARGQTLVYDDVTQMLLLDGKPLVFTFLTRADAEKWCVKHDAHLAPPVKPKTRSPLRSTSRP